MKLTQAGWTARVAGAIASTGGAALMCVVLVPGQAAAQGAAKNPFAGLTVLTCTFPLGASASWKNGVAAAELKDAQDLAVRIDEIDTEGATARVGASHVTAAVTDNSLHFMERTMSGSLTVITVLALKHPNGSLRAVRSRHDYLRMAIPGFVSEPTISQHYGECQPAK